MKLSEAIAQTTFRGLNTRSLKYKRLEKAREQIEKKAEDLEVAADLEEFDYEEAVDQLARGLASRRQIKRIATGGLALLEDHDDRGQLLDALFGAVDSLGRGLLKSLLIGYLIYPNLDSWVMQRIRQFLKQRQESLPAVWFEKVQNYRLLSPEVGKFCSQKILTTERFDADSFADDSGLRGVKGSGGVAFEIFHELSNTLAKGHTRENLERYLDFVDAEGSLRFAASIVDYAKALLVPYIKGSADNESQEIIEHFFLEQFDDPRIRPARWANVPEEQVNVLKRWLAKTSLDLLLNVVSASNDTRHWEERSKFWGHYFDQGLITDAWVALGPAAAIEAKRLVRQGEIASTASYAVLEGGGVQADHSVLFFRLGGFVISEWTHDGKVRIYDERNGNKPHFYQRTYHTHDLRRDAKANLAVIHHQRWKERVGGFIHYELGIAPPKRLAPYKEFRHCYRCNQRLHVLWFKHEGARFCSRCELAADYV